MVRVTLYLFSTHPVMGALRTAYVLNGFSLAYTTEARLKSAPTKTLRITKIFRICFENSEEKVVFLVSVVESLTYWL